MPGIVGIISDSNDDKLLLERMANAVKHKPWQMIEQFSQPPFHIARVHLGIFNKEQQPVFSEDKKLGIFFYGNIYGYEPDMRVLKAKYQFKSETPAEFCLHAYEEYGKDFPRKLNLNGDFILTICDFQKRELIIVNDRFGLIPLYYATVNNRLVFASEVKAILQDNDFEKRLNFDAVSDFFAFSTILGHKTLFQGIEVIPPGSVLIYDGKDISIKGYWDYFHYEPDYKASENDLAEQLTVTFRNAVRMRFGGGLRYGILLSGGLDARAMLAAIEREKRKNIATLTFGVPGCNDDRIARKTAEKAGTRHTFVALEPDKLLTPYPEQVVYFSDGAFDMHSSLDMYVYERIKAEADVICEGLSLDVTLGGSFLPENIFDIKDESTLIEKLYRWRVFFDNDLFQIFAGDVRGKIEFSPLESLKNSLGDKKAHPANRYDFYVLKNRQRRYVFTGSNMRRNFIEVAVPTYDNYFIDVILRTPPELRFHHRIHKQVLKRLEPEFARIVYSDTMVRADAPWLLWNAGLYYQSSLSRLKRELHKISRGKIFLEDKYHFAAFSEWLRKNQKWQSYFHTTLLNDKAYLKDYCRQEFIQKLLDEHESGRANHFLKLDYLVTFELFLRMFVKGDLPQGIS